MLRALSERLIMFRKVARQVVVLNKEPHFFPPIHHFSLFFSFLGKIDAPISNSIFATLTDSNLKKPYMDG